MTKRVTWRYNDPELDNEHMQEDCGGTFESILSPFFRGATCHCNGVDAPFTANFYTKIEYPTHGITVKIEGPLPDTIFFDSYVPRGSREEPNSPNVQLRYNDRFIGVLCPETQTLWATDWTHSHNLRPTTKHIIEELVRMGCLRPVEDETEDNYEYPEYHITMGCDPEFEVVSEGCVYHAAETLGERFNFNTDHGNVGLDGAYDQVELRPKPGSPEDVVENIRGLLTSFYEEEDEYTLTPSSDRYPCGGHIHIGVSPRPPWSFYQSLSTVLDDFIGHPTKRLNGDCRGNGNYGRIGDWREQSHGVEYRTPPNTIFRNPNFARITLQLAHNLAYMLANDRELTYNTPVDLKELVYVGGLNIEDAVAYRDECERQAPNSGECLLAAWGVEITVCKPKIRLEFSEDWDDEIIEMVRDFVRKVAEPTHTAHIRLFGLHEDRGNVYTFPVKDRGFIQDHPAANRRSLGFSRKFRMGEESNKKMDEILRSMLSTLGIPTKEVDDVCHCCL